VVIKLLPGVAMDSGRWLGDESSKVGDIDRLPGPSFERRRIGESS
jgi:hypothetical protein